MSQLKSRKIAKGVTEFKHENYDTQIKLYKSFVIDVQDNMSFEHISELDFKEGYGYPKHLDSPPEKLPWGCVLLGVDEEGRLHELMAIFDHA